LDELDARILLAQGDFTGVVAAMDRAIARAPAVAALRLCRADARIHCGDTIGAAADAAEAVCLDPRHAGAKAVLGIVLIELGRLDEAMLCLREAIQHEPLAASYWQALAQAQERADDPGGAAESLATAVARMPASVTLRTAALMLAMRQRNFTGVVELASRARAEGVADACVFGLLGHALSNLGDHTAASEAYYEAHKLAPEDPYVRHLVRAAGLLADSARAPAEYLETIFDGYAERFEQHLIGLGYRIPGVVRAALLDEPAIGATATPTPIGPILDLGCGTGLVAVALSDLPVVELVGVDVSQGMLAQAHEKRLYTSLVPADIDVFLAEDPRRWPVIVAADVFCYFGTLDATIAAAHARLSQGGRLLFSVETMLEGTDPAIPWQLASQGRYRHRPDYILRCLDAAGFRRSEVQPEVIRLEAGMPVAGLFVCAWRDHEDA
jgi:predicted TPR repeat methyltransferase